MEFSLPWQNWEIEDIQYGLFQTNTRIENGLFVPIYYTDKTVKCQALHVLSPVLTIVDTKSNVDGTFIILKIPKDNEFAEKLKQFDQRNIDQATHNQNMWWAKNAPKPLSYKTALKTLINGDLEWQVQIPDSGIFSCFDTQRKAWYASNESGTAKRKWKILVRTSGLWVDQSSFGMEWKLIGAFVV